MATDVAFTVSRTGMVITDASGWILKVNEAFCALLGYSAAQLLTMSFRDITLSEELSESVEQMRLLAEGTSNGFTMEKRYIAQSGAQVWACITGTPVRDSSGGLVRVVAQIEDLTERRTVDGAKDYAASHDELTGLVNRRFFSERLRNALVAPRRSDGWFAVLVVNI